MNLQNYFALISISKDLSNFKNVAIFKNDIVKWWLIDHKFQLLAKTLSEVDSEEWFLVLGREMGLQLTLYTGLPDEKVSCLLLF